MNEASRPDSELLEAYVEHQDASAFEELYRKYVRLVYSVCHRYLRVPQDAEDAAAACFILLSKKYETIKDRGEIMTWLYSCAAATARNARKTLMRRVQREQAAYDAESLEREGTSGNWDTVLPLIETEIARLPEDQRETVILHFYEGLSRLELAEKLGCSEEAVASRLYRGLQRLRKKLVGHGQSISEEWIASGMTGTALLLPVPESLMLKLAAMAKGETVTGAATEIVRATLRNFMRANLKMAMAIAASAAIVGAAVGTALKMGGLRSANRPVPEQPGAKETAAVPSATDEAKYEDGRIIFRDDFETGLVNWDIQQAAPGSNAPFVAAGEIQRRWVKTVEVIRDGRTTTCASVCVPKGEGLTIGLKLNRKIELPAYAIEGFAFVELPGSRMWPDLHGGMDVRVLYHNSQTFNRQGKWRIEFTPAPGRKDEGWSIVRGYHNGVLIHHLMGRFEPGGVDRVVLAVLGTALIDDVVVRELVLNTATRNKGRQDRE